MHIGFLTPEYVMSDQLDGGLANYVKKTGLGLTQRGHQVTVFVLSGRDKIWQDGPVEINEIKPLKIPRWLKGKQYQPFFNQILGSQAIKKTVWKKHRSSPFDILQASSYLTPGFSLRNNGRVPLVCRISSYSPLCRAAQGKEHRFGDYLCDWLEQHQIVDADSAFSPSLFISKALTRLENISIPVIRTPLDILDGEWDPEYYQNFLSGKKYILYFGTLNRMKGIDLLADVLPQVLNQYKDINFEFVGRDNSKVNGMSYFEYIQSKCVGQENQLHYYHSLPKDQLYPIIANAYGIVIPSRVDNYPNVCLEALSLDVPVVATDESSLEEMITDGETGFLAQNANHESIRQAICHLLDMSEADLGKMRANIHAYIEKIKAEDRIAELIQFYEETIQKFKIKGELRHI
jgi:glycosyltransferase involved in cell wall biosynthesis